MAEEEGESKNALKKRLKAEQAAIEKAEKAAKKVSVLPLFYYQVLHARSSTFTRDELLRARQVSFDTALPILSSIAQVCIELSFFPRVLPPNQLERNITRHFQNYWYYNTSPSVGFSPSFS